MNLCITDIISACGEADPKKQKSCEFFEQSIRGWCIYFNKEMEHCDNLDAQTDARRPGEKKKREPESRWPAKSH